MSTSRRSQSSRQSTSRRQRPRGASRAQLLFAIISSLVICAMIGGVFVSLSFGDVFGDLFGGDASDRENYVDPNSDLIAEQQTVVAQDPDNLEELLLLANLLGNSNRLGDAIPLYEQALQMAPDDVSARVSFARALADGGMAADAELQFEQTLARDEGDQQAHYYLAELYLAEDPPRIDDALAHYRRAAEIDPSTLIGERSQTQIETLGAGLPEASPATSRATPAPATP